MGIQTNRVAQFWDSLRVLTYAEMLKVASEISDCMYAEAPEEIDAQWVAEALNNALDGKPTAEQPTRG